MGSSDRTLHLRSCSSTRETSRSMGGLCSKGPTPLAPAASVETVVPASVVVVQHSFQPQPAESPPPASSTGDDGGAPERLHSSSTLSEAWSAAVDAEDAAHSMPRPQHDAPRSASSEAPTPKRRSTLRGRLKSLTSSSSSNGTDVMEIGGPTMVSHVSHIGWSPTEGFEVNNLPEEWKSLFKAAGVRRRDFVDPETSRLIVMTIAENMCDGYLAGMPQLPAGFIPVDSDRRPLRQPQFTESAPDLAPAAAAPAAPAAPDAPAAPAVSAASAAPASPAIPASCGRRPRDCKSPQPWGQGSRDPHPPGWHIVG